MTKQNVMIFPPSFFERKPDEGRYYLVVCCGIQNQSKKATSEIDVAAGNCPSHDQPPDFLC